MNNLFNYNLNLNTNKSKRVIFGEQLFYYKSINLITVIMMYSLHVSHKLNKKKYNQNN